MSCAFEKESVKTEKKLCEVSDREKIENEINLPDYCQDIKKILRCSLVPGVHSVSISGERVSAKGSAVLRVIYLTEEDKADVFEKSYDLTPSVQMKDIEPGAAINAYSSVDFVNCRAVNQRKFSISAAVSTVFGCYSGKSQQYIKACENDMLQMKTEKVECENLLGIYSKNFEMSETVALNGENPSVGKIVSCLSRIENQSLKFSSGKLLVKADVITTVRYMPEGKDSSFHSFEHTMPLSQIVDVRELPDNAVCNADLVVNQVLSSVKADSSGANKLVELSLKIGALIKATEKKSCEFITDCYCTKGEVEACYEKPDMLCALRTVDEVGQAKAEIDMPTNVKEVLFSECVSISVNEKYTGDKADCDCNALIFIMYSDENGTPCCCEKNIDFKLSYSIIKKCNEPFGVFSVMPVYLTCSKESGDRVSFNLDYRVKGKIYFNPDMKILSDITVSDEQNRKSSDSALTLFYCDGGENLWEIAKSHNTTVDLIKDENGIDKETVEGKMMLLIPCI